MRIIDLSLPLHSAMEVYPGDPPPRIELVECFADTGWNMRRIEINGHDATHVNLPFHATVDGKTLDDYPLDTFMGETVLYESLDDIESGLGLIFHEYNINWEIARKVVEIRPKFIGLPARFEFDIEIERWLLERDVISFERLINTEQLPKCFYFHGAPLNLAEGDGSPVRAYAVAD